MLLRLLRESGTGRPAPLTRVLALLVVVAMLALTAPFLIGLVGWVLDPL